MSYSRQRDSVFFAETPQGSTYFPHGRFSSGVIIPFGREDEFHSFQHHWSLLQRVSTVVATLLLIGAPGLLKVIGLLVVVGFIAAKYFAVRRLVQALPRSDAPGPRLTHSERARRVPPALAIASLLFFVALIAIVAPGIYNDLAAGQPFTVHDAQVLGPPFVIALLLVGLLILRRPG